MDEQSIAHNLIIACQCHALSTNHTLPTAHHPYASRDCSSYACTTTTPHLTNRLVPPPLSSSHASATHLPVAPPRRNRSPLGLHFPPPSAMQFHPNPDLFRMLGGVLCFLSAVLLWSALSVEDYVSNHMLLTFRWQGDVLLQDQAFRVGAFHICTAITFTYNGQYAGSTPESCSGIGSSCEAYLQIIDVDGSPLYPPPGLGLQMRKGCGVFKFGQSCLVISALLFTLTSLVMAFLPCPLFQRLQARWGQLKIDRVLIAEGIAAVVFALISLLCQPDNASDEFDDSTACMQALAESADILDCQTPTSEWGSSFDMHAVAIVLGALGVAFYIGGWKMASQQELQQPLVEGDRGEVGGVSGGRPEDSENWGNANHHTYVLG